MIKAFNAVNARIFNLRKDVGKAVALSKVAGSPMRLGHQPLAWRQAAVDAGTEDEDFTRM
jgi:hypothetical protein